MRTIKIISVVIFFILYSHSIIANTSKLLDVIEKG